MFAAGALPTGLAGWWIGSRVGASSPWALGLIAFASAAFSIGASFLAWRWFVAPLQEAGAPVTSSPDAPVGVK